MKPLKSTAGLSRWLLRISLTFVLFYKHLYVVSLFQFNDFNFYLSLLTMLASVVLFIGGFVRKNTLTVLGALTIVIILMIEVGIVGGIILTNTFYLKFTQFFLAFYFLSTGNRK